MSKLPLPRADRGVSKIIGVILLLAIVILLATVVAVGFTSYSERLGTLSGNAAFTLSPHPAGVQLNVEAIKTEVIVELNGEEFYRVGPDDAGASLVLPTAPGDRLIATSSNDRRSVLIDKTVQDCSRLGDFITYYDFKEGSNASKLYDESCSGNNGTLEDDSGGSGPQWTGDGSLEFDGSDDYVTVPNISKAGGGNVSEFTIAVRYTQTGSSGGVNQVVEHRFSDGTREWFLETSPGLPSEPYDTGTYSMDYAVQYNSEVATSTNVSTGTSHVVVGTYDGSEYNLYVDGVREGGGTHSQPTEMGTLRIGRDWESTNQYFDGEMTEMRLYYHAFDEDEIQLITKVMDNDTG